MKTERQANEALQAAAQRRDWEDAHNGMWLQPAPKRQQRRATHRADYVIAALLACVLVALTAGVL